MMLRAIMHICSCLDKVRRGVIKISQEPNGFKYSCDLDLSYEPLPLIDCPRDLRIDEGKQRRRQPLVPHELDCICFVKRHAADPDLSQDPQLLHPVVMLSQYVTQ